MDPYKQTSYQCGTISIRVDRINPEIDALLRCNQRTEWAFITAWNPDGEIVSPEKNGKANQSLLLELQQKQYVILPGWGIGDDRQWPPEASFLVVGMNREEAMLLGNRYKQRAVVIGTLGQPAILSYT